MQVEDTVMSIDEMKQRVPLMRIRGGDLALVNIQAKISFKAGIREVVEYAEMWGGYRLTENSRWQAKLKEWEAK